MAQIIIHNLSEKIINVKERAHTLLHELHQHGLDWMHACGGKGHCTTCKVIVLTGADNLSSPTESEKRYKVQGALATGERLS
jgi:2Fe-2S ferredoxin